MKIWLLTFTIGTLAFFVGSGVTHNVYERGFRTEKVLLAMRRIGHEILLEAGDSTSRVLPVKSIGKKEFQLQFESSFAFEPNTLVRIIHSNLESSNSPLKYLVSVIDCSKNEIVYNYEVINHIEDSIIPCLGRKQPIGCYAVHIAFTGSRIPALSNVANVKLLSIAALIFFSFIGFGYIKRRNRKNPVEKAKPIVVGKYAFFLNKQLLIKGRKRTNLSAKESKLLKVFACNQNQLLDRARLLKEVWEDDGVFVGRSLDVFVSRLRRKLADDKSIKIISVHGKGYKLEVLRAFSDAK